MLNEDPDGTSPATSTAFYHALNDAYCSST